MENEFKKTRDDVILAATALVGAWVRHAHATARDDLTPDTDVAAKELTRNAKAHAELLVTTWSLDLVNLVMCVRLKSENEADHGE